MNPILPTRLKAGASGLGQANQTDIESRAAQLAHSDGRTKASAADIEQAAAELAGGPAHRDSAVNDLTAWDDPLDQSGHRVEDLGGEDEKSIAEQLIEDGIDEADHDIRAAASELPPE